MNTNAVRFRCPNCRARIKAPAKLMGCTRDCPGCSRPFAVPRTLPADSGPILVPVEGHDHYRLALAQRFQTMPAFAACA